MQYNASYCIICDLNVYFLNVVLTVFIYYVIHSLTCRSWFFLREHAPIDPASSLLSQVKLPSSFFFSFLFPLQKEGSVMLWMLSTYSICWYFMFHHVVLVTAVNENRQCPILSKNNSIFMVFITANFCSDLSRHWDPECETVSVIQIKMLIFIYLFFCSCRGIHPSRTSAACGYSLPQ